MKSRIALGVLVVLLALTGVVRPDVALGSTGVARAGQAQQNDDGFRPRQGATFNLPRAGAKQFRLHQQIVAAINHAKPDSYIRIALFSFDRKFVADQLVKAHKRGVHVQILLNNHQVTPAQRLLHRALGQDTTRNSFAYECKRGCRSRGENLHTKFYLFSHTGKAHNVVMTGSVNLTMNSAVNQYNDLWVRNEVETLHNTFVEVFDQMRKDKWQKPAYLVRDLPPHYRLEFTPYPDFRANNDPIISMLNKVHCKGATGGTGNKVHHTVVRVIMHAWNDVRGQYLAQKVRRLYAAGCDVRLMYGFAGESVRNTFANRTKRGYIPVHTTGYDTNFDGFLDLYTHQKELLIDGNYGGDSSTRMVVTGSSNWNDEGLRGDEEIFSIKEAGTYGDYINNFQFMWTKRSHLVRYIPYGSRSAGSEMRLGVEPVLKRFGPAWENG